ncbi:hypothetical protein K438DRAFT_1826752 [Mycena galopus ATCC 62051]|nr:hypothetical protein K438DRAFT_1826752 [Mycena galopus ATCC 62051]
MAFTACRGAPSLVIRLVPILRAHGTRQITHLANDTRQTTRTAKTREMAPRRREANGGWGLRHERQQTQKQDTRGRTQEAAPIAESREKPPMTRTSIAARSPRTAKVFPERQERAGEMVLWVLKKHSPIGLTTKELMEEALIIWPPGPPPPPPSNSRPHRNIHGMIIQPMPEKLNHPFRSIKYLKKVLANLESQQIIRMACVLLDEGSLTEAERERFELERRKKGAEVAKRIGFRWTLVHGKDGVRQPN